MRHNTFSGFESVFKGSTRRGVSMTKSTTMSTSLTHYIMHGSNVTYNVDFAKSVNELKMEFLIKKCHCDDKPDILL